MREAKDIIKDGEKTRFTSENQPEGRGRKEGSKNRATILKKASTETFTNKGYDAEGTSVVRNMTPVETR